MTENRWQTKNGQYEVRLSLTSVSLSSDSLLSMIIAHVAQLVEHILGKDEVSGSIPLMGSRNGAVRGSGP